MLLHELEERHGQPAADVARHILDWAAARGLAAWYGQGQRDGSLAPGTDEEAAKALEISEQTFHRWRNQYGGMKADDVKRLKELERENATLKRIVAEKELEVVALKEIASGDW